MFNLVLRAMQRLRYHTKVRAMQRYHTKVGTTSHLNARPDIGIVIQRYRRL